MKYKKIVHFLLFSSNILLQLRESIVSALLSSIFDWNNYLTDNSDNEYKIRVVNISVVK